jgi:hypothetical protein
LGALPWEQRPDLLKFINSAHVSARTQAARFIEIFNYLIPFGTGLVRFWNISLLKVDSYWPTFLTGM